MRNKFDILQAVADIFGADFPVGATYFCFDAESREAGFNIGALGKFVTVTMTEAQVSAVLGLGLELLEDWGQPLPSNVMPDGGQIH